VACAVPEVTYDRYASPAREGVPDEVKSILPEWYEPDHKTVVSVIKTGTIALDANALLDLYRMGRAKRDQILLVLRDNRDRLFVPYQVALEYQRNRLISVGNTDTIFKNLLNGIKALDQPELEKIRDTDLQDEIKQLFETAKNTFKEGLEKLRHEHTVSFQDARRNDPVREALDELLPDTALGEAPPDELLEARRAEALKRYETLTPPGYGDLGEKPDPTGDYLIWAELLDHAKNSDRPLLFITRDETKDDWYLRRNGKIIGPRPELVAEMRRVTTHLYYQMNLSEFLKLAKKHLGAKVDDDTIATVENIARETEDSALATSLTNSQLIGQPLASSLILNNYLQGQGIDSPIKSVLDGINVSNYLQGQGIDSPIKTILDGINVPNYLQGQGIDSPIKTMLDGIKWRSVSPAWQTASIPGFRTAMEILQELQGRTLPLPETSEQSSASSPTKKAAAKKAPAKKVPAKKAPAKKAQPATKASAGEKPQRGKKSPKG
jgi:hypothetical protein